MLHKMIVKFISFKNNQFYIRVNYASLENNQFYIRANYMFLKKRTVDII